MLLSVRLLAALWLLLFYLLSNWFGFRLNKHLRWRPSSEAHHVIKALTLQIQFSYQETEIFSLFLCTLHSFVYLL